MPNNDEILNMREVAKLFGISVNTLHKIQQGDDPIPCFRIGSSENNKRFRFKRTEVMEYLENHRGKPKEQEA